MFRHLALSAFSAFLALSLAHLAAADQLATTAEQSNFKRTGRYDEVQRLCAAYQQAWPKQVRCIEFGRTSERRPLLALVVSNGALEAPLARQANRPVLLMQGGIHAGEIDGKDAGFIAIREILSGKAARGVLDKVTLVFVPVFNVDGHERFGAWNRPNQVGPEQMGWRTTAQNLNLNRDYTKADAVEMQAMLRLLNEWDPIVYADLHVTDGAKFQHGVSFNIAPTLVGDPALRSAAVQLRGELMNSATRANFLPLDFYPSFIRDDDPASGFAVTIGPPRFSHEYWGMRNRIGVLVETHSWKDYATRVRMTHDAILTMMESAAAHGAEWMQAALIADEHAKERGGQPVALTYENTEHTRTLDFRGFHYTRQPSAISGALVTRYDDQHPEIWHIPLFDEVRPKITVTAPKGGYIIPAASAWLKDKLDLHAMEYRIIDASAQRPLQTFRARTFTVVSPTFEGHAMLNVTGEWQNETREIPAGSIFVPIAQPRSRLAMALLEPLDPDSFLSWGFFNGYFEHKEYMEAYVNEDVAEQMLQKDPALREEFTKKLASEPEFARDPEARLEFFYRRHPSWDERFALYPIYRVEQPL
jgi:Zinc carboxypeptidase